MLLDEYLPLYDVGEYHEIKVQASSEHTFQAFKEVDMARSGTVKRLMWLRMLPGRFCPRSNRFQKETMTIQDMVDQGFILLAEDEPREIVLGAVGRFWIPVPELIEVAPQEFADFNNPRYGKIGWNIMLEETGNGAMLVTTQTRVRCPGLRALMRFLPYWMAIRPFSGLIRQKMLGDIKMIAEAKENKK